jgi:uncharacterized protein with HEPN domain
VSRPDSARLDDIANAITSIRAHLEHGPISVEIVMDAVAMRLLEIGEAVKGLSGQLTAAEPDIDWRGVVGMRDFLAHHYFATRPDIIQLTLDKRLPPLEAAIERLRERPATPPG